MIGDLEREKEAGGKEGREKEWEGNDCYFRKQL